MMLGVLGVILGGGLVILGCVQVVKGCGKRNWKSVIRSLLELIGLGTLIGFAAAYRLGFEIVLPTPFDAFLGIWFTVTVIGVLAVNVASLLGSIKPEEAYSGD